MRIGITGATGLIGTAIAARARAEGDEVVAFSRRRSAAASKAYETLLQPPERPHELPETRLDALVHLAGESLMGVWTEKKRRLIWQSRVDLTQNLVAHLRTWKAENRPKVLVCASGIGFYGDRGEEMLTEGAAAGTGFLAELCVQWEAAARRAEELGTRVVNLRSGMVMAAEGGALPLLRKVFRVGLGGRLGSGRQWQSWIHVEDEAGLVLWALKQEAVQGPINACAPGGVTNAELTRTLAAVLHRPAFCHVPALCLRLLLRDMADEMLLVSQRAVPGVASELGYRFEHPNLPEALRSLITH